MPTKISYLDETYNPIAMRCEPCSPGCANCWHLAMCKRHAANPALSKELRAARGGGPFCLLEKELLKPLHWKKPRIVGVQFMGDWLHPKVKPEWIDQMLEVMGACPRHYFLTLTKRIENYQEKVYGVTEECHIRALGGGDYLPNHWNGVTVCNQPEADKLISILVHIPAAVRFLSLEPLLGSIDLNVPIAGVGDLLFDYPNRIHQVIVGPETGPGRRPCELAWIRSIVDQCHAANPPVPVHVKAVPLKGHIVTDPDGISVVLDMPIEAIWQWPDETVWIDDNGGESKIPFRIADKEILTVAVRHKRHRTPRKKGQA